MIESYRRVAYISILPLIGEPEYRGAVACFFSLSSNMAFSYMYPFHYETSNSVARLAGFVIALTYFSAFLLLVGTWDESNWQLGTVMSIIIVLILAAAVWLARRDHKLRAKAAFAINALFEHVSKEVAEVSRLGEVVR